MKLSNDALQKPNDSGTVETQFAQVLVDWTHFVFIFTHLETLAICQCNYFTFKTLFYQSSINHRLWASDFRIFFRIDPCHKFFRVPVLIGQFCVIQ